VKTVINAIMNAVLLIRMVSRLLLSDIVRFLSFLARTAWFDRAPCRWFLAMDVSRLWVGVKTNRHGKVTNKFRKSQIFYKKYSYSVRFSPYIILLSCEMQLTLLF